MSPLALPLAAFLIAAVPGATDPAVTQANIAQTICVPGYAGVHRPDVTVTEPIKRKLMKGQPGKLGDYELDHLVPISLGGALADPANLWLEPLKGPHGALKKDKLEVRLHSLVCKGKVTLINAQTAIRTDWIAAYRKYVGPLK